MAQNESLQVRYGKIVEAKLRSVSVFAGLFNNRYEGMPKAGAVKIPVRAEATASEYTICTGIDLACPTTTYETLVLDNDYAVNELIDGYVAAAVPDGMIAERLDSAGYALGAQIDTLLAAAAEAGTGVAATDSNIVKQIIKTAAKAKKAGVNPDRIWIVLDPETEADVITDQLFVHASSDVKTGEIGKLGGYPVYVSNRLSKKYVVGNSDFCHFVNEWMVLPDVVDLRDGAHIGASAVQGREIFGYKITKPATVFVSAN